MQYDGPQGDGCAGLLMQGMRSWCSSFCAYCHCCEVPTPKACVDADRCEPITTTMMCASLAGHDRQTHELRVW